jgi:hypothetical protein
MLYNVSNTWNCGFMEDYTTYSENGFSINSTNIKTSTVQVHKYQIESLIPPSIINTLSGKYIVPGWVPCHPKTELSDIKWIQKISKKDQVKEIDTWRFKSSSGDGEYVTKRNGFKYTCNCRGYWMAKDKEKGCKHIQEVKSLAK